MGFWRIADLRSVRTADLLVGLVGGGYQANLAIHNPWQA
ncbi:MAG: hypothetical protein ANABAC_3165 [Anaerolineae bacterium]|jgi:hypothetical protein|nr:MAG: hypothetical protein ANABAC_3165 [Anaerolineae bacterium]